MPLVPIICCGALVGAREIIPGVSGGSVAVMPNIYGRLIESISHLRRDFKKASALIGMAPAIGVLLAGILLSLYFTLKEFGRYRETGGKRGGDHRRCIRPGRAPSGGGPPPLFISRPDIDARR